MDQPNLHPTENGRPSDFGGLVVSTGSDSGLARLPAEAELATMRQMMESLFARVDALQQHQAVQLAGVHDRLDAVELEVPLIQEQTALRMRDLEVRMSGQIEEATAGLQGIQEEVAGKFGSLAAQIEMQHKELDQMRESKRLTEDRLDRIVNDIERLCGTLGPRPAATVYAATEAPASPYRTRIASHIRKAAVEAAPDDSNPLIADPKKRELPGPEPQEVTMAARVGGTVPPPDAEVTSSDPPAFPSVAPNHRPIPRMAAEEERVSIRKSEAQTVAEAAKLLTAKPAATPQAVPGFDDWKRQFMQDGEPLEPTMSSEVDEKSKGVVCPKCFSDRTRLATRTRLDGLFRLTGFIPHRCRSCSHRFYKRGTDADAASDAAPADTNNEEVLETR